jgi:hypothetical protein
MIYEVHIPSKAARQRKDVLHQRSFCVRQRTRVRNRIHRLLGAQHNLHPPQCRDLFGKRGLGFLDKLDLPAPAGLLLKQQLGMLRNLYPPIAEDNYISQTTPGSTLETAMHFVQQELRA